MGWRPMLEQNVCGNPGSPKSRSIVVIGHSTVTAVGKVFLRTEVTGSCLRLFSAWRTRRPRSFLCSDDNGMWQGGNRAHRCYGYMPKCSVPHICSSVMLVLPCRRAFLLHQLRRLHSHRRSLTEWFCSPRTHWALLLESERPVLI